ncbi:unnamed protein product [Soboliphyme baturini]|uniref:Transpos_assoc domain-containing protein n=1 Tax=Soboliphyme baturini TaxID=241478 RepID=A0A183IIZ1_9BILA|nr:unnamed protein product [Soboliphyme baturini]
MVYCYLQKQHCLKAAETFCDEYKLANGYDLRQECECEPCVVKMQLSEEMKAKASSTFSNMMMKLEDVLKDVRLIMLLMNDVVSSEDQIAIKKPVCTVSGTGGTMDLCRQIFVDTTFKEKVRNDSSSSVPSLDANCNWYRFVDEAIINSTFPDQMADMINANITTHNTPYPAVEDAVDDVMFLMQKKGMLDSVETAEESLKAIQAATFSDLNQDNGHIIPALPDSLLDDTSCYFENLTPDDSNNDCCITPVRGSLYVEGSSICIPPLSTPKTEKSKSSALPVNKGDVSPFNLVCVCLFVVFIESIILSYFYK